MLLLLPALMDAQRLRQKRTVNAAVTGGVTLLTQRDEKKAGRKGRGRRKERGKKTDDKVSIGVVGGGVAISGVENT